MFRRVHLFGSIFDNLEKDLNFKMSLCTRIDFAGF